MGIQGYQEARSSGSQTLREKFIKEKLLLLSQAHEGTIFFFCWRCSSPLSALNQLSLGLPKVCLETI